jgi:predicted Rossmann fold flavoprotein
VSVESFDVIVVGGGPAGLMAAVAAREQGAHTLLLEKGNRLGRKLAIFGGGRCNVTNIKPLPELLQNIPGNGRFVQSALHRFSNQDIIRFFEGLGIRLKEEDRGRVFPVSDRALDVVAAMVRKVRELGVCIRLQTPVRGLWVEDGRICGVRIEPGRLAAPAVVVATGGCSVPKTGSTGDAYPWARAVGHTIVPPYPTEVPLCSDDPWIRERRLQGLSLRSVTVTLKDADGKRLSTEEGDLLFTHFGLSGPAALRCSHYVSTARRRNPQVKLWAFIDVCPGMTETAWLTEWQRDRETHPKRQIRTELETRLPDRLAAACLDKAGVDGSTPLTSARKADLQRLARTLKAFPLHITGTLPLEQATVTGGGVSVREIDPRTMMSKLCPGLFFAGEVMDVHAHTGGYNITVAFSTGHLAGESAARYAAEQTTARPAGGLR